MRIIKVIIFSLIVSLSAINVTAQDIFYGEVGVTGGCGFVLGDENRVLFNYVQPLGGAFLKYKFNGHYELRAQLDGGLLGIHNRENANLTSPYVGLQVLGEFNFFNYGVKKWEAYRTWATPTIFVGLGMMYFNETHVAATFPFGVGAKFKLSNRINVGVYWMMAKVFSDHLDHTSNPIGLNKGFWTNRDWYSTAQVYLSVNFYKICAPCRDGVVRAKPRRR